MRRSFVLPAERLSCSARNTLSIGSLNITYARARAEARLALSFGEGKHQTALFMFVQIGQCIWGMYEPYAALEFLCRRAAQHDNLLILYITEYHRTGFFSRKSAKVTAVS